MSNPLDRIELVDFESALSQRYLAYALSTIVARSLPDVRDGLKPVHRRLLFAMEQLKLDPKSGYKKCARVVGDVIGKFHPHGDTAVYDAMVRLAQDFAVRYPLVDGHGNFGNIDGDNAAAMRYTEAKLTLVAKYLLQGLDRNAVDFRATYDGEGQEPVVMPAAFPNLLANGATGIAVGMATSIPPHNVAEICTALETIIEEKLSTPNAESVQRLLQILPGPDFPTGGIIVESPETIAHAYITGRGSLRIRARWEVEKLKNGSYQIVVTEIPYQVLKSRLIEKIAELMIAKKLPLLGDIHDESTDTVRLILEPKTRQVDPEVLMESLFRMTELESRFSLNLNVLDARGVPQVMNLHQLLLAYLDHRVEVLQRVTRFRLDEIANRLELLNGYLIAYLNLDEVIRIIREEDDSKAELMQRFSLTDRQAEGILNMRLRSLRKLEEIEIRQETQALEKEQRQLNKLLESPSHQMQAIRSEIQAVRQHFGQDTPLGARRTTFATPSTAVIVPIETFIEREPVTIVCSEKTWIRAFKGHTVEPIEVKYKDGDQHQFFLRAHTTDRLLVFSSKGKFYTIGVDKLAGGKGFGEPMRLYIDLAQDEEIITLLTYAPSTSEDAKFLIAAEDGRGFMVPQSQVLAQTKSGKQVLTPRDGTRAAVCVPVEGDHVAVVGNNRKLLVFPLADVPLMNRGQGVMLQKYKDARLSDITTFTLASGLSWRILDRQRTERDLSSWLGQRGQVGRFPPVGFPRTNKFIVG
jgi:topoisomerase-4 subunit A